MKIPLAIAPFLFACGGSNLPPPSAAAEVADYTAEGLACVDAGGSRAEIDACRSAVRVKYGRSYYPPPSDAGGDR